MIDSIYARSRHEWSIDYGKPLSPSLKPAEELWLEKQLRIRSGHR